MNYLLDVSVNAPALSYGVLYRRKVVVEQNHVGGLFGDVGARYAHGDADIGLLQGGTVVHAVARHGGDFTRALQRFDYSQLIRGRYAREHHAVLYSLVKLFVGHLV